MSLSYKKDFYTKLILLATPILLQNLVSASLNFLDVFMVGQLNETALAAVGIGNQIYFLFIMLVFGISSASGIYASQYWGKKDLPNIHIFLGIGYILCLGGTLLFTAGVLLFPEQSIGLFSPDPQVRSLGGEYLYIVGWSYPATTLLVLLSTVLRSTEEVKVPMITSIIGLALNTILNYLLIFGHFGFPEMGVKGAAIATLISRLIQGVLIVAITYSQKLSAAARLKELFCFTKEHFSRYLKTAAPVIIQNFLWAAGSSMYTLVYSRISTEAVAAYNVVTSVERICIMFFSALGHAAITMIGNRIGAGESDKARLFGKNFLKISLISAIIFGAAVILLRKIIAGWYEISPEALAVSENLLFIMAFALWAKAGNISLMMGTLRAGGDTKYIMFVDVIGIWGIGVPIAFLTAFFFKLKVEYVAALIITEEVCKFTAVFIRFKSGRWLRNLTDDNEKSIEEGKISRLVKANENS